MTTTLSTPPFHENVASTPTDLIPRSLIPEVHSCSLPLRLHGFDTCWCSLSCLGRAVANEPACSSKEQQAAVDQTGCSARRNSTHNRAAFRICLAPPDALEVIRATFNDILRPLCHKARSCRLPLINIHNGEYRSVGHDDVLHFDTIKSEPALPASRKPERLWAVGLQGLDCLRNHPAGKRCLEVVEFPPVAGLETAAEGQYLG